MFEWLCWIKKEQQTLSRTGIKMNRSSSRGFKLTTVIFAVLILAVSAIMSNSSFADDTDVIIEQSQ